MIIRFPNKCPGPNAAGHVSCEFNAIGRRIGLHHAEVIHFTGRSYRMEQAVTRAQKANSGPKAEEKR